MEQIEKRANASTSWLDNLCQKMMYSALRGVTKGCLRITFGDDTQCFGDPASQPQASVEIYHPVVFRHMITRGSIGVAEDFIEDLWATPDLTRLVQFFTVNQTALDELEQKLGVITQLSYYAKKFFRRNSVDQAKKNILAHYDLGNHLYRRFLDPNMQYSSAIYPDESADLGAAQVNKMQTICDRLQLCETDEVVEIGTGWGGLAIYMAQQYGCKVTTTTISDAQHEYVEQKLRDLNLQDKVTLLKQDYRSLEGKYDKLVSIEMIEAVGHEYLDQFFTQCSNLLKDDGLMLIQAITIADQRYEHYRKSVDFIQTYIFPGGCLPSVQRMTDSMSNKSDLIVHQLSDIGLHYAKTLADWREKFLEAWPELKREGFDNRFKRLWLYYLCYCEGGFLERAISTVHLVARKPEYRGIVSK